MLHQKIELHSELPPDEAAEVFRNTLKKTASGFHGKEEEEEFIFDYKGKELNAFRPEIRMKLLPDADGTLFWADMKLPKLMLWFMVFWTVLPVIIALWGKNWLVLLMIPVFWIIAVINFRIGVKRAKTALMAETEAVEIVG